MAKKLTARAWARQLPKPVRNGRFYRLGGHVAVVMAGHAHQDGTGITVAVKTLAEETWCTLAEVSEALEWLETEKWFTRVDGARGTEWACNFEVVRDVSSEIDERLERKRALGRARWHRFQEAKKTGASVSEVREGALVGCVSSDPQLTHPTNELTQETNATNAPNKRSALVGGVRTAGHSPEVPKKAKEEEVKAKTPRSADAESPLTLVDPTPSQPKTKPKTKATKPANEPTPQHVLADAYHKALDGNTNFLAVRGIIKAALAKYPFEEVKRGVDALATNPGKPFTKQTLWVAMKDGGQPSGFQPFQSTQFDYTDHGGFGA